MARRLQLGSPVGNDEEARWRWIEESLRQIERASHEDNLGGVEEAFDLIKVAASSTYSGVVELATVTEVLTGTDAERAVTPDALAGLWEEGPDITWASTISVGEGGYFHVIASSTTGSIAAINFGTQKEGRAAIFKFDSPGTLVYSAGLVLPTSGVNITVSSGDVMQVVQESSVKRVVNYQRADGTAVSPSTTVPVSGGGTGQVTAAEAVGELIQACSTMSTADRTTDLVGAYDASGDTGAAVEFWRVAGTAVLVTGSISAAAALDVALDGFTQFRVFKLFLFDMRPETDNVAIGLRFSDDGGASFEADASDYGWEDLSAGTFDEADTAIALTAFGISNTTGETSAMEVTIYDPHSSTPTLVHADGFVYTDDGIPARMSAAGIFYGTAAATDVRLFVSSGNIAQGKYALVGIL